MPITKQWTAYFKKTRIDYEVCTIASLEPEERKETKKRRNFL